MTSWVMWEAKAAEGRTDALLAWALENSPPSAQVYRSDDRVVVISEQLPDTLPDPPDALIARPPFGWTFDRVR